MYPQTKRQDKRGPERRKPYHSGNIKPLVGGFWLNFYCSHHLSIYLRMADPLMHDGEKILAWDHPHKTGNKTFEYIYFPLTHLEVGKFDDEILIKIILLSLCSLKTNSLCDNLKTAKLLIYGRHHLSYKREKMRTDNVFPRFWSCNLTDSNMESVCRLIAHNTD